ncbi:hypothetical protein GNF28_13145 [Clostridium perfringens]|uniref:hypothetical protein n=1 Tax=Clostridium perfringens TaxID=1502 RepID=UPI002AC709DF|nr:hypothetical protein [Clostridium perfringens]MDZ4949061.1 hypothetical protein [Clostridium perfringens]
MIKINKSGKIIIVCMPDFATGGTELLHQLAYKLKKRNFNVYMYYVFSNNNPNPVADRFKKYDINFLYDIEDIKENIVIIPEIYTTLYNNINNARKVVWWLSVDNYYKSLSGKNRKYFKNKVKLILNKITHKNKYKVEKYLGMNFNLENANCINLVQSQYAYEFLKNLRKEKIYYLSDYLNDEFLKSINCNSEKKDIVLYNPAKGFEFTKKLIEKSKGIEFLPICNMSPKEVRELLQKSKVYIDFGNHPGKDRFPREAAICGCCIITGKDGSAKYYKDIPILDEYKYEANNDNIPLILNKIHQCLTEYDKKISDFKYYRDHILIQEKIFDDEIDFIFKHEERF